MSDWLSGPFRAGHHVPLTVTTRTPNLTDTLPNRTRYSQVIHVSGNKSVRHRAPHEKPQKQGERKTSAGTSCLIPAIQR